MSRSARPSSSFQLPAFVVAASLAALSGGCAVQAEDTATNGGSVVGEPTCGAPVAPLPSGWTVREATTFSVAAPSEGLLVSQPTPTMLQFYSREPGTTLAAFERRDVLSLDEAAGTWKRAFGDKCVMTSEPATHRCDPALRLHATCAGGRTSEVLVVHRHGATYAASCELTSAGDADTCAQFLATLSIR